MSYSFKTLSAGVIFAILWGSASTATKTALVYAQPFVISVTRFFLAAFIMLFIAHILLKENLPQKQEWKRLMIYGLLNISIYLGLFVIGMQYVSAGIASLFIGTNPVFISIMVAIWLKQPIKRTTGLSLLICSAGILIAAWPLLQTSYVTLPGLLIILLSMISYSLGTVYFSKQSWNKMHILTINGWQTLFGGIFTIPFLLFTYKEEKNTFNWQVVTSILLLAVPVSIGAVQLWMYLLKKNPVKASFWLFLCPIFGIIIAALLLHEPVSLYTFGGVALVLAGLYMVQGGRREAADVNSQ
jgi:drug/metabolite transporter (DMT)-like permease